MGIFYSEQKKENQYFGVFPLRENFFIFSIFELGTCVTYKIFSSGIFGGVDLGAFILKNRYKEGHKRVSFCLKIGIMDSRPKKKTFQ
jgi:hypothetical protein